MVTGPDKVQTLDQLQKIISSKNFAGSPRKREFLRYIVEKTLGGEADSLKAYAIGVDVFERNDNFDPQSDTIVRVQASNLRKSLEQYYLTDGQTDPVRIDVPKGKYIPRFSWAEPRVLDPDETSALTPQDHDGDRPQSTQIADVSKPRSGRGWRHKSIFLGLFIAGFGLLFWLSISVWNSNATTGTEFDQAARSPTGPSIGILRFKVLDVDDTQAGEMDWQSLSAGLQIELIEKISRFQDLFVKEISTNDVATTGDTKMAPSTDFILSGMISEAGDHLRILSFLTRTSTGEVLWTREFNQSLDDAQSIFQIQTDIAVDVAVSLGQPYSSVYRKYAAESGGSNSLEMEHYMCLMQFYEYQRKNAKDLHFEVRECLEKATTERPGFSSGWAALSQLYLDEYYNRFNLRAESAPPIERALEAAKRAVEADPENAMAYRYLSMAKYVTGDEQGFREASEKALNLNPNDPEVLAMIGRFLVRFDGSESGRMMVEKAMEMNPAHPMWYHGPLILYFYDREETASAMQHAREFYKTESLPGYSLYTAVLVQDGQIEEAKRIFAILEQKFPHFSKEYKTIIQSRRLKESMYTRLIADLETAGLTPIP